jgi:hypothetical protein
MGQIATVLGAAWCGAAAVLSLATPAAAIDDPPGDWDALKACEKRVCTMILSREAKGEDLSCQLAKTWAKSTLDGSESKLVKWGYGDARCTARLEMSRAEVVAALTEPKFKLDIPEHHVKCEVESDGKVSPVDVKLAPRIEFKAGKAHKIWINLKEVTGPTAIKGTVWAAAKLEDSLGIFHKSMVKSVNRFVHKQCAERYDPAVAAAVAKAKRDRKSKKAAAADGDGTDAGPAKAAVETTAPAKEMEKAAPAEPASKLAADPAVTAKPPAATVPGPAAATPPATAPHAKPDAAPPAPAAKAAAAAKPAAPAAAEPATPAARKAPAELSVKVSPPWAVPSATKP